MPIRTSMTRTEATEKSPRPNNEAFLKRHKKDSGPYLSAASGVHLLAGSVLIAQCFCLAYTIDAVLFKDSSFQDITPYLGLFFACVVLRSGLVFLAEQLAFHGAGVIVNKLRHDLFATLLKRGPVQGAKEQPGDIAHLWIEGAESLRTYYAKYIPARMTMAFLPLAILLLVFPVDWISGVVFLVTAPLIPFFMIMIGKGTESLNRRQWKRLSYMSGYFLDRIQGLTTLKLFNAGKREVEVIAKISDDYRLETMRVLRVAFLSSLMLEFLATVSIAIIAVLIGFRLLWGNIEFLQAFFILLLAPEFYLPLRRMGGFYHARMDAVAASERLAVLLKGSEDAITHNTTTPPPAQFKITFENVSFSYDGITPVLDRVSFTINSGEHVAIIGPSGAGKSTILSLLLGFVEPRSGRILINDIPLSEIDPHAWRAALSWVPQKPHLFNQTLFENLTLAKPDAVMDEIPVLAESLHVADIARDLPQGYDSMLGEDGVRLSGGQIQRIALLRALLRPSTFMLMDEPTASLDHKTEAAIRSTVDKLSRGRSVLTIAHRLHTIHAMDKVILLKSGKIIAFDTPDIVLKHPELHDNAMEVPLC